MSERKEQFTPGMWRVLSVSHGSFSDACIASTVDGIETATLAIVCGNNFGFWRDRLETVHPDMACNDAVDIEMTANANLISAAPDLYGALKVAIHHIECTNHEQSNIITMCGEALKKARGE